MRKGNSAPRITIRKASPVDLEPLQSKGAIFYGAAANTLECVLANGVVRSFEKGQVIFEQGERTDNLPFYCVLSGRFDVIHIWGENQRHVATDTKGALIGDVELLLRGEPANFGGIAIRQLSTDQTWGKVRCSSPGDLLSIWPADFLLNDHAVTVALARSLARKLLLRSAATDPKMILSKPKQVELFLRRTAMDLAETSSPLGDLISIPMSLADIAAEVECAKQTVAIALADLAGRYPGFSHQRSLIVVPRSFLSGPSELFVEP